MLNNPEKYTELPRKLRGKDEAIVNSYLNNDL